MRSYFLALGLLALALIIPLTRADKGTTFKLEVSSSKSSIEYYKTKSQWQLMKGDKTCRGFYLPRPKSKWKCEGDEAISCTREFECSLSNKNYNRKTEIRRLANELQKMKPQSTVAHAVVKTQKTLVLDKKKPVAKEVEVVETKKSKKIQNTVAKSEAKEYLNNFSEFTDKAEKEDMKQLEAVKLEPRWVVRQERSLDGRTTVFKVRPKEDKDIIDENRQPFVPLAFSGAMAKVSDSNTNTLSTTDVSWNPRYRFKNNWGMRGHAGGHFIKATIGDNSETFLVTDFGLIAEYYLSDNFYFDGGLGIQKWNSTTGGAFSTMTIGAGYQFDFHKINIIDRIFTNYQTVGNEDKNKELKFGIGISF